MINSKELRQGNIISLGDRWAILSEIGYTQCIVYDLEETQDTIESYERVRAIPSSGKLLLAWGFTEINGKQGIYHNRRIQVYCERIGAALVYLLEEDTLNAHYLPVTCDSLHHIQNIFYFTMGMELKYNRTKHV